MVVGGVKRPTDVAEQSLRQRDEPREAQDWLERAVGTDMYVGYLGIDPTFRSLHAEPRFRALLRRE